MAYSSYANEDFDREQRELTRATCGPLITIGSFTDQGVTRWVVSRDGLGVALFMTRREAEAEAAFERRRALDPSARRLDEVLDAEDLGDGSWGVGEEEQLPPSSPTPDLPDPNSLVLDADGGAA